MWSDDQPRLGKNVPSGTARHKQFAKKRFQLIGGDVSRMVGVDQIKKNLQVFVEDRLGFGIF